MDGNGCFRSITQRAGIISTIVSISVRYIQPADGTSWVEVGFYTAAEKKGQKKECCEIKGIVEICCCEWKESFSHGHKFTCIKGGSLCTDANSFIRVFYTHKRSLSFIIQPTWYHRDSCHNSAFASHASRLHNLLVAVFCWLHISAQLCCQICKTCQRFGGLAHPQSRLAVLALFWICMWKVWKRKRADIKLLLPFVSWKENLLSPYILS